MLRFECEIHFTCTRSTLCVCVHENMDMHGIERLNKQGDADIEHLRLTAHSHLAIKQGCTVRGETVDRCGRERGHVGSKALTAIKITINRENCWTDECSLCKLTGGSS